MSPYCMQKTHRLSGQSGTPVPTILKFQHTDKHQFTVQILICLWVCADETSYFLAFPRGEGGRQVIILSATPQKSIDNIPTKV